MTFRFAFAALVILTASTIPLETRAGTEICWGQILPEDTAAKDSSFVEFRERLREAVKKKDSSHVLSILAPQVRTGADTASNIQQFKQIWKPDQAQSRMWPALETALSMGGLAHSVGGVPTVLQPGIVFPTVCDPSSSAVIRGTEVKAYSQPNEQGKLSAILSHNIVQIVDTGETVPSGWIHITLPAGGTGFVPERFLHRATDVHALFQKRNGKWMLTQLLGGGGA